MSINYLLENSSQLIKRRQSLQYLQNTIFLECKVAVFSYFSIDIDISFPIDDKFFYVFGDLKNFCQTHSAFVSGKVV